MFWRSEPLTWSFNRITHSHKNRLLASEDNLQCHPVKHFREKHFIPLKLKKLSTLSSQYIGRASKNNFYSPEWGIRRSILAKFRKKIFASFSVSVSVLQHNPFVPSQKITLPYMGLYVYELTDRQKTKVKNLRKLKVMFFKYTPLYTKTKVLANFQQTVIRCSLNANNYYVIIPCLFKPEDEAKFLLRVYADGPFELDPLTN